MQPIAALVRKHHLSKEFEQQTILMLGTTMPDLSEWVFKIVNQQDKNQNVYLIMIFSTGVMILVLMLLDFARVLHQTVDEPISATIKYLRQIKYLTRIAKLSNDQEQFMESVKFNVNPAFSEMREITSVF